MVLGRATLTLSCGTCDNWCMASVEFSDAMFQQLRDQAAAAGYDDVASYVESLAKAQTNGNGRFDANQVLAGFRELEGMFGDAKLADVLADRRVGRD